ncbi:MAG TPA: RNA 2',3'-cyclic phosphodiesterase [Acidimicrobiales bacterium]|nr:RNA 2',3'-cyclic phosphodiesterase [Acidimicrobiales bacterium]
MRRLFVAVWPPEEVLDQVAALPRPAVEGLRWTARDQWHVTLRFLGPVPEVEPVAHALAALPPLEPSSALLGPATGRFDQRILHVPVRGLDRVATAVVDATASLGTPPDDRPFHGHLTLARVAKRAKVDLRPLAGAGIEARWPADVVCLVESRLSPKGARYDVLERFRLTPPPPAADTGAG